MLTRGRFRLLILVLAATSAPALATGPGIFVGSSFEEHFANGFDDPAAVTSFTDLSFEPGHAVFGANGSLVYTFNYDPVDTRHGEVCPNMGTFWVEFVDDLDAELQLEVTVSAERDTGPFGMATEVKFAVGAGGIVVSISEFGTLLGEQTVDRVAGLTRIGFPNHDWVWNCVVENEEQYHEFYTMGTLAFRPVELSLAGTNVAVESVTMATDAFVDNAATSVGRLKARYHDE